MGVVDVLPEMRDHFPQQDGVRELLFGVWACVHLAALLLVVKTVVLDEVCCKNLSPLPGEVTVGAEDASGDVVRVLEVLDVVHPDIEPALT
jgi:hypothetical protein